MLNVCLSVTIILPDSLYLCVCFCGSVWVGGCISLLILLVVTEPVHLAQSSRRLNAVPSPLCPQLNSAQHSPGFHVHLYDAAPFPVFIYLPHWLKLLCYPLALTHPHHTLPMQHHGTLQHVTTHSSCFANTTNAHRIQNAGIQNQWQSTALREAFIIHSILLQASKQLQMWYQGPRTEILNISKYTVEV